MARDRQCSRKGEEMTWCDYIQNIVPKEDFFSNGTICWTSRPNTATPSHTLCMHFTRIHYILTLGKGHAGWDIVRDRNNHAQYQGMGAQPWAHENTDMHEFNEGAGKWVESPTSKRILIWRARAKKTRKSTFFQFGLIINQTEHYGMKGSDGRSFSAGVAVVDVTALHYRHRLDARPLRCHRLLFCE